MEGDKFLPEGGSVCNSGSRASFRVHSSWRPPRSATRLARVTQLGPGQRWWAGVGVGGQGCYTWLQFGLSSTAGELTLDFQSGKEHGRMSWWLPHQAKVRASGSILAA